MKINLLFLLLTFVHSECIRILRPKIGMPKRESQMRIGKSFRNRYDQFASLISIYDPSSMAVVWSKITNGVHLTVGPSCWADMTVFFKDFVEGKAWAYKAVDATGRYQPGLFSGNRYWLGSRQQCLQLTDNKLTDGTTNETKRSLYLNQVQYVDQAEKIFDSENKYESVRAQWENFPPYLLAYSIVRMDFNITKVTLSKSYIITLGVCFPDSCSSRDVSSILNFSIKVNDNLLTNGSSIRTIKITSSRRIEVTYSMKSDVGAIIIVSVTIILIAITLAATAVDLEWIKIPHKAKSMSFDIYKYNINSPKPVNKIYNEIRKKTKVTQAEQDADAMNDVNNSTNIQLMKCNNVKSKDMSPPIVLEVSSLERLTGSCNRCGKYRKQCPQAREMPYLPTCPRVRYNSFASLSTQYRRKNSFFVSLFLCFSLNYSWKKIVNTNMSNRDLSLVHVLKILSTCIIVFVHVAVVVGYLSVNAENVNEHSNLYNILLIGTLSFDTLLFISGLFSAHHIFYLKSRYTVKELVCFGGVCGQILQYVCFVANRAVRLLPSYAYVVFLSGVVYRVSRHTAPLVAPGRDHVTCDMYWWRNLLYVTNFYPKEERCTLIGWYLSLETQLHAVAVLTCALLAAGGYCVTFILLFSGLSAAVFADVIAAYNSYKQSVPGADAAYAMYIDRPWARVAPYFIGVLTGWLVQRLNGRLKISKIMSWCLWLTSCAMFAVTVAVPLVASRWVTSVLHVAWPLAVIWPAITCSTQHCNGVRRLLCSSVVAAVSRMSYGIVLLHAAIANSMLLAADTPLCSYTICIWLYFAGVILLTLPAALLLCLLIEMPFCSLLRRLSDCAKNT